jgi:ubiquinone/menaquinone biosynthesis C-methylase UbiE
MKNEARHKQLNEAKWDSWASTMDREGWRKNFLRRAQSKVLSLLELNGNVRFLDIGCGTGWAIGKAAELAGGRGEFYGADLSAKMIEKAKENFSGRDNFHFLQANAEEIPLEGDFFDIIICTNSFHHYLHPEKAVKEMHRLLNAGGKLYILDPTADLWIAKWADKIFRLVEPEHVKMYSSKEFQQLFEQAGLKYSGVKIKREKVHIGEK